MDRLVVVGAVVLSERGLLLVSKEAAPDVFYLPGGKPEAGETFEQCLRREVREELGVGVTTSTPSMRVDAPAALENMPMEMHVFDVTVEGTPAPAAEIADLAWWPERTDLRLAPAIRDVVIPALESRDQLRRSPDVVVRRVPATTTVPLRAEVLRPGRSPSAVVKPGDDDPDTWFFAALEPGGRVLATVNVRPSPPPWDTAGGGFWQLRGMATAPDARGNGHARAVVDTALDHVDRARGRVWCNARTSVLEFYRRFGFTPVGDEWLDPVNGPHYCLLRP